MQNQLPSSPKEALRAINILFYAMVIGVLIFSAVIYFVSMKMEPVITDKPIVRVFHIALLAIGTIVLTIADRGYKKRIATVRGLSLPLMNKLEAYRAAMIVYLAACEGIGIFGLILYFLTENKLFLVVTLLALLGMLLRRPEKSRIFNDLQLSSEEQMELH